MIVLERANRTAAFESVWHAFKTHNWGTTPCKQEEVASGNLSMGENSSNESAWSKSPPLDLPEFTRDMDDWYEKVRELSPTYGDQLDLEFHQVTTDEDAQKALMLRIYDFLEYERDEASPLI